MDSIKLTFVAILMAILSFFVGNLAARAAPVPPQVRRRILRVAVVDTGLNSISGAPICASGHADFSGTGDTADSNERSHGSNVAALIAQEAGPSGYCLIIVKVFGPNGAPDGATVNALRYVAALHPDVVNLSWGGLREIKAETQAIKQLLDRGTIIVAAAGNNGINFDRHGCVYFPSCSDERVVVVGNSNESSNYGRQVDVVINGNHKVGGGADLSGSSQSCAIYTGRLIKALLTSPSGSRAKVTK